MSSENVLVILTAAWLLCLWRNAGCNPDGPPYEPIPPSLSNLQHGPDVRTPCEHIPPGLSNLKNGVDITKLDFLHRDPTSTNGFRLPILEFTCDRNRHQVMNQVRYEIPDQVWSMQDVASTVYDAKVKIFKTTSDVLGDLVSTTDVELLSGMYSASPSYKTIQNILTKDLKYIEEVSGLVSVKTIHLVPSWALDDGASSQLDRNAAVFIERYLPDNLEGHVDKYLKFVNNFGTHFMRKGNFGGMIHVRMATDIAYYDKHGDEKVATEAKATYLSMFSTGRHDFSPALDTGFTDATTTSISYFGGQTNLLSEGHVIQDWQTTVSAEPWLLSAELEPIVTLIKDDKKKKNLERVIQMYIDKAYLEELERFLSDKEQTYSSDLRSSLHLYKTQITDLLKLDTFGLINHSMVEHVGKSVKQDLVVPSWFSEGVNLCFKWYYDGDSGQCGGGAERHLCATPDKMTHYYQDNTDGRGGGCQMSWGLESRHASPTWFSDVEVCYEWYHAGDSGQCGGGAKEFLCAKAGSFTPYYRDDTDNRAGGCRMRWKLSIPISSPLWLSKVSMCFEWYPDGDAGQCGGGVDQTICARANVWTTYYLDNTDKRDGGCQMRWGLRL